ncbi:MAG TPA: hypothetical protein VGG74_26915 [Kofleriaceae bacterium]|jgi:hypothetical protein
MKPAVLLVVLASGCTGGGNRDSIVGDGAPDAMQPGPAFGFARLRNMDCRAL